MHLSNFAYLTNRLQEAGFGVALNEALQYKLKDQPSVFELPYKACFGSQVLDITVYVKKWKQDDMSRLPLYYVQKYHASLSRQNTVDRTCQDFYFGHPTPAFTIQEAYNLLCGRAVYRDNLTNKEKIHYNAWVQLDFSQTDGKGNFKWQYFHENYGYDVAAELMKYPILGLAEPDDAAALVRALQQGYREGVTMLIDGKVEQYYIEALPKFKSLVIYDAFENPLPRPAMMSLIAPAQQMKTL